MENKRGLDGPTTGLGGASGSRFRSVSACMTSLAEKVDVAEVNEG